MQSEIDNSRLLMIWTTAISLTLFCATVISAIAGWAPHAWGHTGNGTTPDSWRGMNSTQLPAVPARPAFFTVPADQTQTNETPKTTKG